MTTIESIYDNTSTDLSLEEFKEEVEKKHEEMGGLLDKQGSALALQKDLESGRINSIEDIDTSSSGVRFTAKVLNIEEVREFERDNGAKGEVVNIDVADESGQVQLVFWNDMAEEAAEDLSIGDVIRVKGKPEDGYPGIEINVDKYEHRDTEINVKTLDVYRVADLSPGLSSVTIKGLILDTSSIHTFERDDGTEGQVGNIVIGDKTGQITITLWGEAAELAESYRKKVSVKITDGNVRKNDRNGDLEIHVNDKESIETISEEIQYVPSEPENIEDAEVGDSCNLVVVVNQIYEESEFDRDDGSIGTLRNILVQDETGSMRLTLWGEKKDANIKQDDKILITNVEIKEGMDGGIEGSVNSRSTINIVERGFGSSSNTDTDEDVESDSRNTGLSDYDGQNQEQEEQTDKSTEPVSDSNDDEDEAEIEFVGTVLKNGGVKIVDDNGTKRTIEGAEGVTLDINLGEQITIRGVQKEDKVLVNEYF